MALQTEGEKELDFTNRGAAEGSGYLRPQLAPARFEEQSGSHPASPAQEGQISVGAGRSYSAIRNDRSSLGLPREVTKVSTE